MRGIVAGARGGQPRAIAARLGVVLRRARRQRDARGLEVHLADEQGWLATFELDEAMRPDAQPAVAALRALGLRVQLLSGDRGAAVKRLARRAGIESGVRRLLARGQAGPRAAARSSAATAWRWWATA